MLSKKALEERIPTDIDPGEGLMIILADYQTGDKFTNLSEQLNKALMDEWDSERYFKVNRKYGDCSELTEIIPTLVMGGILTSSFSQNTHKLSRRTLYLKEKVEGLRERYTETELGFLKRISRKLVVERDDEERF